MNDSSAKKIIIGGIVQESNTFSIASSTLDDFRQNYLYLDDELLRPAGKSELGGFLQALSERGAKPLPTLYAGAVSSGRIPRATVDQLKQMLYPRLRKQLQEECDGILFAMHGAWVCEDEDDLSGEVLGEIRALAGPDTPIVISLDSHANVTRRIVDQVNGIVGYRTFPHVDYTETGYRAAQLLLDLTEGRRDPVIAFRKVPMIVPAENHQTARGPMKDMWDEAAKGEGEGVSVATSLFAVQPWLDVKEMGCSVVVVGERSRQSEAESEADRLAKLLWDRRRDFDVELMTIPQILGRIRETKPDQVVVCSDSADSPGAGSPGDSNQVLRQLLENGAEKWLNAYLSMVDADAARYASSAGEGASVRLKVGHSISHDIGQPLEIEGEVVKVGDGKFRFGNGYIEEHEAHMGHCAVIAIGKISLLLMELPVFTGDPAMYRSVGLEPAHADLVLVKSACQFRSEYERLSSFIYILDTPGASTANIRSLPFRHIPRPMYPFDGEFHPGGLSL